MGYFSSGRNLDKDELVSIKTQFLPMVNPSTIVVPNGSKISIDLSIKESHP